ncbi:MAG: ABC transporter substrate-binding protein [Nitrososphaerales archaeon]
MSAIRYAPIIIAIILAISVFAYADVNASSLAQSHITLRVGYPDSLDESDVADMYANQLLKAEGILVVPTFYDSPPLSYQGLISNQEDISYVNTVDAIATGPTSGSQTTCVYFDGLASTFLEIVGGGITQASQMIGKTTEDFGAGSATRALNYYWFAQAGVSTSVSGHNSTAVNLKQGGGNFARVADIQSGATQGIVVDDFILNDFLSTTTPDINNSAHGGPFHVLFYSPTNYMGTCYTVRDSWLQSTSNQQALVKYLEALTQAQRWAISNPSQFVTFAAGQLPLTAVSEIQYTSTLYPATFTFWPYGNYNLMGAENLTGLYTQTNNFYKIAQQISSPVLNSSVTPYGVVNGHWELQALQALGPYCYPHQSWVTPQFESYVNSILPTSFGGFQGSCA